MHGKLPCSWKIRSVVKSPARRRGRHGRNHSHADHCGVKEVYKATKVLAFDTPTDVTLTGDRPEPVCLRVAARRPAAPIDRPRRSWCGVSPRGPRIAVPLQRNVDPAADRPCPAPRRCRPLPRGSRPQRIPDPLPLYPPAPPYVLGPVDRARRPHAARADARASRLGQAGLRGGQAAPLREVRGHDDRVPADEARARGRRGRPPVGGQESRPPRRATSGRPRPTASNSARTAGSCWPAM